MAITNRLLKKFLAGERFYALFKAYRTASNTKVRPELPFVALLIAVVLALFPTLAPLAPNALGLDMTTFFVGLAAAFGLIYRNTHALPFPHVTHWRESLSLTHTAVALGCIPVVALLIIHPQALYVLGTGSDSSGNSQLLAGQGSKLFFIAKVATWSGLTEEIIYRGCLISIARRFFAEYRHRDLLAIVLASLLFGIAHLPSWGIPMSLALMGLGVGFGVAYVAIGEKLMPVVIYHILFDCLSLGFAMVSYKGG